MQEEFLCITQKEERKKGDLQKQKAFLQVLLLQGNPFANLPSQGTLVWYPVACWTGWARSMGILLNIVKTFYFVSSETHLRAWNASFW